MEEWKDIDGYEGYYQVSNIGRVRSLDRIVPGYHTDSFTVHGRILKPIKCINGYDQVQLHKFGTSKPVLIHRLVAKAFIPNPDNLPEVNHKDENTQNNNVSNLEWCTSKYNANYGTRNKRCYEKVNQKQLKPVNQIDLKTGEVIKRWDCIQDVKRELHIDDSQIIRICKKIKNNRSAGGFGWEYAV